MLNCICWGHFSQQFWRLHLHRINTFCFQNTRKLFSISITLKKWNVMIAVFQGLILNCNAHCFRFISQQHISFPCSTFSVCTKASFSRPHTARGDKYTFVHTLYCTVRSLRNTDLVGSSSIRALKIFQNISNYLSWNCFSCSGGWASQCTVSILGPAPTYMMTATAALCGIAEVHLSWLRSLLLLRALAGGVLSPNLPILT